MINMEKIVLKENFNLIDIYDLLLESQGVIDGTDGLNNAIYSYIKNVLKSDTLKDYYYIGHDVNQKVEEYKFTVPSQVFKDIDTLFMINPIYNISLFVMDNPYGDKERQLGECNYESLRNPIISEDNGDKKLDTPVFNLFFVVEPDEIPSIFEVSKKVSHELVHAKKNFYEYLTMSKKREGSFNRDNISVRMLTTKEQENIEHIIGRILYLCSNDEINARSNQLYFELKRVKILTRLNINNIVKKTNVYDFVNEMDAKIEDVLNIEKENNINVSEEIKNLLKIVYNVKTFKDPYRFLYNLLINRKNYFIRKINKVKERVLYEIGNEPVKK